MLSVTQKMQLWPDIIFKVYALAGLVVTGGSLTRRPQRSFRCLLAARQLGK